MKILFIGDIIGNPGRSKVKKLIPEYRNQHQIDFVIANGENSAGGVGLTEKIYEELLDIGVDVITSGNHVWHQKDFLKKIDSCERLLRPANYPPGVPGKGQLVVNRGEKKLAILNLMGRVFLQNLDCPFRTADTIVEQLKLKTAVIIVDVHAEATSEKSALGWFLDARVSAVIGTHTHVQTADERILPQGTGFITDVGMVGARDSVIGVGKEAILERFIYQLPKRFEPEKKEPIIFNAVILDIDEATGKTLKITRIFEL